MYERAGRSARRRYATARSFIPSTICSCPRRIAQPISTRRCRRLRMASRPSANWKGYPVDKSSVSTGADSGSAGITKNAPQRGLYNKRWRGSLRRKRRDRRMMMPTSSSASCRSTFGPFARLRIELDQTAPPPGSSIVQEVGSSINVCGRANASSSSLRSITISRPRIRERHRQQSQVAGRVPRVVPMADQRAAIKGDYDDFLGAIPASLGQDPVGKALDARPRHVALQLLDRPAIGECQLARHDAREGDVLVESLADVPGRNSAARANPKGCAPSSGRADR